MNEKVILACARVKGPLLFPDNRVGQCAECGFKVEYRPHAPRNRVLRCMECAVALIEPNTEITTTPRMLEDARTYFRKKQQ